MSNSIGPADLIKFQSGLKISDFNNWKHVPASAIVQPTAQMKAEMAAGEARAQQLKAEHDAQVAATPELYSPVSESNMMYETNVMTLAGSDIKPSIDYITNLIQSGEAAKYSFHAANGDQTTTSIHQFLYWLQQRAQELDGDGTYSPEMFK
ncbi:hypothetical protein GYN07_09855 [Rhizobium leguminosarum bv. viciae 248]|uniref:hypothetical protein n=1 Tax=Rhizobium leguminosarum TaxID=384 RepID=UPI00037E01D6|nr:hypothetical protein [Rhizobium leguminosarum]MCA2407888.1 hypothetical protein [Rhizobium leguminosarum]NKM61537.1 hypothetical protein [Rhizobium leguminosarum bv. viciae]QHW24609.1 hypothetical protein GYN07_09855 [Rhizobium leguminosarum bv. viciae 248]